MKTPLIHKVERQERKGYGDLITIYTEDDEMYHESMSFDIHWLEGLIQELDKVRNKSNDS